MSILGELPLSGGTLKCNGNIAYAAQQPWVFSATVRQNVIFGQPFDQVHYQRVLKASAFIKVKRELLTEIWVETMLRYGICLKK